ncbi:syndecan-like [Macrosteles quadrilineatus]|uniref:syndecan-like n=1 Tax=Macrosteles quadrilineatus TaxID=74068 RepID=UPI0023E31F50|nr:syndecan-like [Macrosteles quadrilineatus]
MYLRLNFLSLCILIFLGIAHTTAEDKKLSQPPKQQLWQPTSSSKDDIYIDDEALEGSGNREIKYDLESSGSGFGPDDEDGDGGSDPGSGSNTVGGRTIVVDKPDPPPVKEPPITRTDNTNLHSINENEIGSPYHNNNADNDNNDDNNAAGNDVYIMNAKHEERATSFFAQPGILAAVIGGAVVGLLCAILVVMFIVYRMRKKDEGSYALEEPKRSPTANSYTKNSNREFYA